MNTYIGAFNILPSSTVTASAETTGYEAVYAYEHDLTEQWKPGVTTATLTIDAGAAVPASYLGLVHSGVTSIAIEGSADDISYTPIATTPAPATSSMTRFTEVSYRYYKLTFIGASTMAVLHVGVGAEVKIEGYLVTPFTPFAFSQKYEFTGAVTRGALPLGRAIMLTQHEWSMSFQLIDPVWAFSTWASLYDEIVINPFYVAWDVVNYPTDVLYAWIEDDVTPPYDTTVTMVLQMSGKGYR